MRLFESRARLVRPDLVEQPLYEHGEASEDPPFVVVEQLITPADGVDQCLTPFRCIPGTPAQGDLLSAMPAISPVWPSELRRSYGGATRNDG